jgi:3-oxoacyl-[acyl-carrier-protein] synthase-3
MDGAEVFEFTLRVVPDVFHELLARAGKTREDIDLFIFHQANQYMLESLRIALDLPKSKFYIAMRHCGNTVSSTIPIALTHALMEGKLSRGNTVMLVGFGVGYSWGAVLVRWM